MTLMEHKSFAGMNCSIAQALEQVGERWSLLIVRECVLGTTRFDEFQRRLGIARNILTARLARLVELGVLERVALEGDARQGYELTRKGEELMPVLMALLQWGDRWAPPPNGPSVKYVDTVTGKVVPRLGVRGTGARVMRPSELRLEPGPGATAELKEKLRARNERLGL